MKKFNLVLLVLVAALFGSSLVACSNAVSGDPETPTESYVTAVDSFGAVVTFIPVPGCNTADEVKDRPEYSSADCAQASLNFDLRFGDRANVVKNSIFTNSLYHNNEYIVYRYNDGSDPDEIYKLEIDNGDIALVGVTAPESAR